MKRIKSLLLLALCCLILCQTTVNVIAVDDEIETYEHYDKKPKD